MILEVITKPGCPKCVWLKGQLNKDPLGQIVVYRDYLEFPQEFYDTYDLKYVPVVLIYNDDNILLAFNRGITIKSIEKAISEHCLT